MAAPSVLRRGLPRVPGGEPWPPASAAPPVAEPPVVVAEAVEAGSVEQAPAEPVAAVAAGSSAPEIVPAAAGAIRRGLPRVPGGEPWPPASAMRMAAPAAAPAPAAERAPAPAAERAPAPQAAPVAGIAAAASVHDSPGEVLALRRGLPRVAGGEPWPPAAFTPAVRVAHAPALLADAPGAEPAAPVVAAAATAAEPGAPAPATVAPEPAAPAPATPAAAAPPAPLPFTPTVFPGAAAAAWKRDRARATPLARPEPRRIGPFTGLQWAGAIVVGGLALVVAAGMLVLAVRWFVSLDGVRSFLATYPGEYHLPDAAPVGIPAWLGWQHFFNAFLILLIIRSGLQVRTEKRPTVFWTPKRDKKAKISLALWFHQSLDLLWLINGAIFVVLLFVTGQWMRIVPTSWEVFPNAVSAALQYVSLDWPTENGWVNYNALQQLSYFAVVFLAAPLAAITGVRMSKVWPKNATRLSRAYPIEWARAVHFPTMIFFVAFIVVHVALVLATGALRNLNHMYGGQDAVNWTGFWIFIASLVVMAAGWVAARPLVLAPIAGLFGTVKGR